MGGWGVFVLQGQKSSKKVNKEKCNNIINYPYSIIPDILFYKFDFLPKLQDFVVSFVSSKSQFGRQIIPILWRNPL